MGMALFPNGIKLAHYSDTCMLEGRMLDAACMALSTWLCCPAEGTILRAFQCLALSKTRLCCRLIRQDLEFPELAGVIAGEIVRTGLLPLLVQTLARRLEASNPR